MEIGRVMAGATAAMFGAGAVDPNSAPLPAFDDFGALPQRRPGAHVFSGNGTDGAHGRAQHNPTYGFDDCFLANGAEFWARLAETQLAV